MFAILRLVVLLPAIQAYTAKNYSNPNGPYFAGDFAVEISKPVEVLTVVSYNIWFREDIDQALSEVKEIQSQNELDILLLREMDEITCNWCNPSMAEVPEVETIVRDLRQAVVGRTITGTEVLVRPSGPLIFWRNAWISIHSVPRRSTQALT